MITNYRNWYKVVDEIQIGFDGQRFSTPVPTGLGHIASPGAIISLCGQTKEQIVGDGKLLSSTRALRNVDICPACALKFKEANYPRPV